VGYGMADVFGDDWLLDQALSVRPEPHALDAYDMGYSVTSMPMDASDVGPWVGGFDPSTLMDMLPEDVVDQVTDVFQPNGGGGEAPAIDVEDAISVVTNILSSASDATSPEAAAQAAAKAAIEQLTPEGSPLRDAAAMLPSLATRQSVATGTWTEPSDWTNEILRASWDSAQDGKNLVILQPRVYAADALEVMRYVAETETALRSAPMSVEKSTIVRDLQELASGLYLTSSTEDGTPVTNLDPAQLAGSPVVYLATVEGIRFDADSLAFASKTKSFAAILASKAQRLAGGNAPMESANPWTDTAAQVWQSGRSGGALAMLGVGVLGMVALVLLARMRK